MLYYMREKIIYSHETESKRFPFFVARKGGNMGTKARRIDKAKEIMV